MSTQLDLDGRESTPRRRRLTERQRELLEILRWYDEYRALMPTWVARRFYADPSGALGRLQAIGLVERVGRGRWRPR